MKALTFVTLFLFSAVLQAASVELSWQHPSARTDGQPLDVSEISHTAVAWQCGDQPEGSLLVDAPAASVTIDDLPNGDCEFSLATVDVFGLASEQAIKSYTITPGAPPAPPTWLDILIAWLRRVFGLTA